MGEIGIEEMRELLVGTWAAIAVIAEVFIKAGFVAREEILEPLAAAEIAARDRRELALRGVRMLVERLGKASDLLQSK
jgi:hypothetical protein